MLTFLFALFKSDEQKLNGDFERETVQHMDSLYNFAYRMTGDRKSASKLIHETYYKAFKFWAYLEKYDSYKSWLLRILKNTYNAMQKKTNQNLENLTYDEVQNIYEKIKPASVDDPLLEKQNYENLFDDELSTAISSLPEDFRIVLILCDIEGFTYDEIADFVDVPVGTVRSRLNRARKMLFTKLYKYAGDKEYLTEDKK